MKKEDLIKLGLDEATATKVEEASNEELKGFIPKTRFDEVNDAKKQLEQDIKTRDKQLDDLKIVDAEGLKTEIEKLQGENKTAKEKFEADLKKMKIENAVDVALLANKAKNTKAVKALMAEFLEKAEFDGDVVKGLDVEIKKLTEAEDSKFMFDIKAEPTGTKFKGINPGEKKDGAPGEGKPSSLADAVKMHFQSNE